jgi:hypothetical protein
MSEQTGVPTQRGSFAELRERLPLIQQRAARVGVDLRYDVRAERPVGFERHLPMFAASLGKLPLALMLVTDPRIQRHDRVVIRNSDIREGGGAYDLTALRQQGITGEYTITVDKAVMDMLARSGNTAYRVLSRDIADLDHMGDRVGEALNKRYNALGFEQTTVVPREAGAELGETTPEEVIRQLNAIQEAVRQQGPDSLAATAWHAMASNERGSGMRLFNMPEGYDLVSKTGEYNGDDDDAHVYRHEAGHLILPDDSAIEYCFMTRSRSMNRAYRAVNERVLSSATNEVAKYAGLRRPRLLGLRALSAQFA